VLRATPARGGPLSIAAVAARSPRLSALYERLKAAPIAERLARGAFWTVAANVVTRFVTLGSSIALARLLGKDVFGKLGIVQGTVMMYAAFAGVGAGSTATKYVAELRTTDPARAGRILALAGLTSWGASAIISVLLFVLAPVMAERTLQAPDLTTPLRLATVLLFFGATNTSQTGALAGLEAFKSLAKATAITLTLTAALTVLGAVLAGFQGALVGSVVAVVVTWLVYHIFLRIEARKFNISITWKHCTQEWSVLWRFSVPALLAGLVSAPALWASSAMLVREPNGYAEMAVLTVARQWQTLILFLPTTLGSVLLPVLVNLEGIKDRTAYIKTMRAGILVTAAIAAAAAIVVSLASILIMSSYGPSFRSGWATLVLLSFGAVFVAVTGVVGVAITSAGRMWVGMAINTIWALVFMGATLAFVRWGAAGIAGANLVAYGIHLLTTAAVVRWVLFPRTAVEADPSAQPG
jgi:O-antigen/teichoic acid export membrane protein